MNGEVKGQSAEALFSSSSSATTTTTAAGNGIGTGGWRVEGVEVNHTVNIHLPEDRINHVNGTWAILERRARKASVLMFVYPRDGALVRRYIDAFMTSVTSTNGGKMRRGGVQLVLWLGPKCDWEDAGFGSIGTTVTGGGGGEFEVVEIRSGPGLAEFEMLAALRWKKTG